MDADAKKKGWIKFVERFLQIGKNEIPAK